MSENPENLFFDIKQDRITKYTIKNNKVTIPDLDKYIDECIKYSSKKKILTEFNYLCPVCLDILDVRAINCIGVNFIYCDRCENDCIFSFYFENFNHDLLNVVFNNFKKTHDNEKIFKRHEVSYLKEILDHSRKLIKTGCKKNKIIENYLWSYFVDEYVIQYTEVLYNVFSIGYYHDIFELDDIYKIIYVFSTIFDDYDNTIFQNIIREIVKNGIYMKLQTLYLKKDEINSKIILKIYTILFSLSNDENQEHIKKLIVNLFNKGMSNLFDEDKICNQIFNLGKMIQNGTSLELIHDKNDKFHNDEINHINMGNFQLRKYKFGKP